MSVDHTEQLMHQARFWLDEMDDSYANDWYMGSMKALSQLYGVLLLLEKELGPLVVKDQS